MTSGPEPRVAFQGAYGAFSELAIARQWPDGATSVPCRSFPDAITAVVQGDADYAVIPVENAIVGPVRVALDALAAAGADVVVRGELRVPIHLCLMAPPGATLAGLRDVRSHAVALAQCRIFFARHPWLQSVPHEDTAGAARDVAAQHDRSLGAVAGESAAARYGLEIIARNIEDVPANWTRFLVISRNANTSRDTVNTMRNIAGTLALLAGSLLAAPDSAQAQTTPAAFSAITRSVHSGINGDRAKSTVAFVQQFYRLPGKEGFDAAIDTVAALLRAAGYVEESSAPAAARLVYRIESRPMRDPAWTPLAASITLDGQSAPLQAFARNLNMIAANSIATPPGGVRAELVHVGIGADSNFARVPVAGRIVFTTGNARVVLPRALKAGALGVIAAQTLPPINQQERNRHAIQFSGIARDTLQPGWLLYASRATRDSLEAAMTRGPVRVHVEIDVRIARRPERTLIAEVRGRTQPQERFVYSAHVQEPGANDNASGVGALAEMARVAADLVRRNVVTPQRTVTFLWGDEISSTDRYIKEDSLRRTGIKWGMSLDMVGENTATTGGTFLIEKMPDPSAVWVRGEDQHSEWGGRPLAEKDIRAHWFNDFVRNRCLDRARQTNWVVKANPFEGGSDHTPFLRASIPAVLLWHFTDQFYHTDLDRIEHVSSATLANVGACALTTGLLLAEGTREVASAALDELVATAQRTLATQAALSRDTLSRSGSLEHEQHILGVWRDYYLGAIDRIPEIVVGPVNLTTALDRARAQVRAAVPVLAR